MSGSSSRVQPGNNQPTPPPFLLLHSVQETLIVQGSKHIYMVHSLHTHCNHNELFNSCTNIALKVSIYSVLHATNVCFVCYVQQESNT